MNTVSQRITPLTITFLKHLSDYLPPGNGNFGSAFLINQRLAIDFIKRYNFHHK